MNIELFKDAIAVIRGIPESRINLDQWQAGKVGGLVILSYRTVSNVSEIDCSTLACAGGWLALYPPFQKLGLRFNSWGVPSYRGYLRRAALAEFFDILEIEARDLFGPKGFSEHGRHKTIWLRRAVKLLRKYESLKQKGMRV